VILLDVVLQIRVFQLRSGNIEFSFVPLVFWKLNKIPILDVLLDWYLWFFINLGLGCRSLNIISLCKVKWSFRIPEINVNCSKLFRALLKCFDYCLFRNYGPIYNLNICQTQVPVNFFIDYEYSMIVFTFLFLTITPTKSNEFKSSGGGYIATF
jgi:hypothetical protein